MPYIKKERRQSIANGNFPESAGELNYAITKLLNEYLWLKDTSYATINDIVGALEGAKLEFYRRIAVPYEDKKIVENGDVYK